MNTKRYWLRGGIIGMVLSLLVVTFLTLTSTGFLLRQLGIVYFLKIPFGIPFETILEYGYFYTLGEPENSVSTRILLQNVSVVFNLSLIGSLIGFFIRKKY